MNGTMVQEELIDAKPQMGLRKKTVANFGAGPAKLPEAVMMRAQMEFREYQHMGIGVLEMSHRSKEFTEIMGKTKQLLGDLLHIPADYEVLMMQGGGTGQFAALPLNLGARSATNTADYIVTGDWSNKAFKEAGKFVNAHAVLQPQAASFNYIPPSSTWKLSDDAAYVYYCANETIHGVEFHATPETNGVPLVCDMSSNILSKAINVGDYGAIFAGTQKNLGAAGLTLNIMRKDLIATPHEHCPSILSYKQMAESKSVYNTPPVYSIYLTKLVLEWIRDEGGVEEMERRNTIKADMLYDAIDGSDGFYHCPISKDCRSRMNVPFRIGGCSGVDDMEADFLRGASDRHMISLKGHRSVGGIRASLYNAVSIGEVQKLCDYMTEFKETFKIVKRI